MKKNRNFSIDFIRAVACFMIVGIHSTPSYLHNGTLADSINNLLKAFYHVGLPAFFMISGYLMLSSQIKNLAVWYFNRLITIVIPFVIISFFHYIYVNEYQITLNSIINFATLTLRSNTAISIHFWFVYSIIGIYLITPALSYLFSGLNKQTSMTALIIFLAIYAVNSNYQSIQILTGLPNIYMPPSESAWVFYFMIGGFLYHCTDSFKVWQSSSIYVGGFVTTALLTYLSPNKFNISFGQYDTNVSMVIYTIGFFTLMITISKMINSGVTSTIINFISKQSYIVYLLHVSILTMFYRNLPEITTLLQGANLHIVITVICFIVSVVVSYIIGIPINKLILIFKLRASAA